jgi:DNA modification methylase
VTGTATILRADARSLPIADASVDLIVTSPPYFALRSYTDGGEHYDGQIGAEATPAEYITALLACTVEWARVLKPTGSIFVNLGDKYAEKAGPGHADRGDGTVTFRPERPRRRQVPGVRPKSLMLLPERYRIGCADRLGLIVRQVQIWSKPNGLPESVKDRTRRAHEDWVHLTKRPRYYADLDPLREEPTRWDPPRKLGTRNKTPRHTVAADYTGWKDHMVSNNPLGTTPGSVWVIPTEPLSVPDHLDVEHYAAFPTEWPRRLITGWCPAVGTVLDPFGGTGTTALVAKVLGRHGISVDRSADYCRLAEWRTTDPGQLAKAMRVEKPPPQLDGQSDLLAELGEAS